MFDFEKSIVLPCLPHDLTVIGELLVDMIANGYEDDCGQYSRYFGGAPSNIAVNASKLSIDANIVSAVGRDNLGDFLVKHVRDAGIATDTIQRVSHSTSIVLLNRSVGTPIPVFYRGADYHIMFDEKISALVDTTKILHFSCWPLSRNPARATTEKAIQRAKLNKSLVCFDPNYHPKIWGKEEDAIAYIKSIIQHVDIIKPSEDDAERLFGQDTRENQIDKFLNLGAKLVILTLGEDGAIVSNGTNCIRVKSMAIEVADATGAGDAFWAGFYAAVIQGAKLVDALHVGFAVSAYKLKHVGAIVDLPKLEQIQGAYNIGTEHINGGQQ